MNHCKYIECYQAKPCGNECEGEFCSKHLGNKCSSCGKQATHECNYTGQFVCGAWLCDDCSGYNDYSQSSGNWGFMNHSHKPKQSQPIDRRRVGTH